MVKLIAKQALDSSQLPGVTMLFKPHTAYFYDRNDDNFRVAPNALKEDTILDVHGDGFRYLFSEPLGAGTVTEVNIRLDKEPYYKVTGLHVKLDALFDADLEQATKLFFKGKDEFKGSPGNDIFDAREGKDKLLGKDGVDTLYGGTGNDTLDGGKGNDTLNGGGGTDTYVFKTTDGTDSIVNLKAAETIELGRKAFSALTKGALPEDQFFVTGSCVQDENDYIVYTKGVGEARGVIQYDPDGGAGSAARIMITTLQPEFDKLVADNFLVI
jgi:Ca2+-binding RTX toxin-like protein